MRSAHRLTMAALATLGVLAGGLVLAAAPVLAATPEAPVTKAPTLVTGNTATFNGELNPGASSETVSYRFAYTPGPSCANARDEGKFNLPEPPAEAGGNHTAVSATAENLSGSTEYTVCLVAGSEYFSFLFDEELALGSSVTFTTPAAKPLIRNEHAFVTPFEARIEGAVNANNQPTTCKIEYGKTTGYGSELPCEPETLAGGEQQAVGATVTGLQPATTYYYRIVATNGTGATEGPEEFTTLTLEAPIVESERASGLTPTDATLEAKVNPNYQATSYSFEYSTEATGEVLEGSITTVAGANTLPAGGTGLTVAVQAGNHLTLNTIYHYRVVATNETGTTDGTVQEFTTLRPPVVSTGEAVGVAQTSARVTGTVNPEGLASTYEFQYGTRTSYEQSSPILQAGEGSGAMTAPGSLTDLAPSTLYHYRLVATNDDGTSYGEDQTLTTLPGTPPTATTGGASAVSQNAATISGTIGTNGRQTSYGFEIGTEAGNYGPATGLGSLGGDATQTVSVSLGELQPATTYHYRVLAVNGDGASYGADQAFTTPGFPTLVTVPPAPPLIATPAIAFPAEAKGSETSTPKPLTNAQRLAAALKACNKKPKSQRPACRRQAHKKYAPAKKKNKKKKKRSKKK